MILQHSIICNFLNRQEFFEQTCFLQVLKEDGILARGINLSSSAKAHF